jgi:hypothetical protein
MTRYHAVAWCDRTFTAQFEVEADNPEAALAKAKEQVHDEPAEECDNGYPWDTFLINGDDGERLAAEEPANEAAIERDRLMAEVERLARLVYVPGLWRCAELHLVSSTLHAHSGTISANNEPQQCANGCGPMWRVTERDAGNRAIDAHIAEREKLNAQIAELAKTLSDVLSQPMLLTLDSAARRRYWLKNARAVAEKHRALISLEGIGNAAFGQQRGGS